MNLRMAVLLTNDDTSAFASHFPNDGQKVVEFLKPLRPEWSYEVVSVKDGVLPARSRDFDGYVITGSPASVNDDSLPWVRQLLDFIRAVHAARQPLVGLCFGHQAVARALGGLVARNAAGWGLGTAPTHWHVQRLWMTPHQATTTLMAAHNEQVTRMPEGAECLGGSDFCPIGSMQIGQHIWTTQFHPEMPLAFMQALLDYLANKIDANTIASAQVSLANTADVPLFGHWMVQFLEHARNTHP
ncbi:type 1 glutamine amidotransferase [Limnohabitans sp. Rim8]|uniref:type 1 glutamine amidotransferase n=1 Tax=Limnohabitans sp. Rim8 TaxID=1100718 RepID=UPI002619DB9A|nr:type 1 glutamine amidotransferase [Limnohabitans sp. Rim8]